MIDIDKLEKDFDSTAQLKELSKKYNEALKEILRLKAILESADIDVDASMKNVSDEELFCMNELEKLREYSSKRDLDLDEIRKFDLLNKNIRLIREKSQERNKRKHQDEMSLEKLAELAKQDKEDD